jgi:hypothetical protein
MADHLGIHPRTLLRLRAASFSPFREGEHYRHRGLTTKAPLHWHSALSEEAFTTFRRIDPASAEGEVGIQNGQEVLE